MYYLLAVILSALKGISPVLKRNYVKNLSKVKLSGDIYLLVNIAAAIVYFFLLAGGNVPLNTATFLFSAVYAFIGYLSVVYNLIAFKYASVVYVTVITGSLCTILPFVYELIFTDISFSAAKILSVFCRIAAICMILIKNEDWKISLKGAFFTLLTGLMGGLGNVLVRMYSLAPNVTTDGSLFFWTNVVTLPIIVINVLRKVKPRELKDDFKKIKPANYVLALGGMIIGNAETFFSVEIMRHISATGYSVIGGSVSLLTSAFVSTVIYKEDATAKTYISVLISILAVVLSLM